MRLVAGSLRAAGIGAAAICARQKFRAWRRVASRSHAAGIAAGRWSASRFLRWKVNHRCEPWRRHCDMTWRRSAVVRVLDSQRKSSTCGVRALSGRRSALQ
ncbi:hypothetical protein L596_025652 [Steinernema carpocapsae]|uniref:Uncharacterized protein n=1 Tax=Steinernema carpocapsae TaxID=34508 RepID=A0A4U5M8E6_STECR|nr:hypothetical protein L596_025652 [Steinernema carpocapsae]